MEDVTISELEELAQKYYAHCHSAGLVIGSWSDFFDWLDKQ